MQPIVDSLIASAIYHAASALLRAAIIRIRRWRHEPR